MTVQSDPLVSERAVQKSALGKRLDAVGWGLFLVMIGVLWLFGDSGIPEGTWLICTAAIVLGISLVRYVSRIRVSGFWVVVGLVALGSGVTDVWGESSPIFPALLILIGVLTLFGTLTGRS